MNTLFQIGDLCFEAAYPEEFVLPANTLLFRTETGEPEYHYTIRITDVLPTPDGEVIARRPGLTVLQTPAGESRQIGIQNSSAFYAVYEERSAHAADIHFLRSYLQESSIDTVFNSLLALERRMLSRHGLILHCAYIRCRGEAILFSAPSGTGKSTQADLWERYRGTETINGDRALLQPVNGRWIARGWPVCGSSEICHPVDTPIRAIVMLSQAPENTVEVLRPVEAFSQLYSQITINSWNTDAVTEAMDLIEDLRTGVPLWHLACNISEDAVRCLEEALFPPAPITQLP